jgi:hypothetical protein
LECPIAVTYNWSEKIKCQRSLALLAGRQSAGQRRR